MELELSGLCERCDNERCRLWLSKNLDGIKGRLQVEQCEYFTEKKL